MSKADSLKKYYYKIYGISLESELQLPSLVSSKGAEAEVCIKYGKLPSHLPSIREKGLYFESSPNDFLFKFQHIAKYRIQNGTRIEIEIFDDSRLELVKMILLGTVMGILLHQRGIVPIHGSAIHTTNGAYIFSGPSTIGKSSLLAWFIKLGFNAIADDIAAIKPVNKPILYHGIPQLKLWIDVLDYCNLEKETKIRPELEKYRLSITEQFIQEETIVGIIFILEKTNTSEFSHEELYGSAKVSALIRNTYRNRFVNGLGLQEVLLNNIIAIAKHTLVVKVYRPGKPLLIKELAEYIGNNFMK